MSDKPVEIPIEVVDATRPSTEFDVMKKSESRSVKLVPTPFGSRPAIWTSPYVIQNGGEICKVVIVLLAKGPPKPETAAITIPKDFLEKLPEILVEW